MSNFRPPSSGISGLPQFRNPTDARSRTTDWIARMTCRYVPYSIAVTYVNTLLRSPLGMRRARRRCAALFSILDEQCIEYDPTDTAIKHMMMRRLFPWAYCRLSNCSRNEFDRWVSITGLENLTPLLDAGRGILLLSSHFGLHHAGSMALRAKGYAVYTLRGIIPFKTQYGLDASDRGISQEIHVTRDKSPGRIKTTTMIYDLLRRGNIVASALDRSKRGTDCKWLTLMGHKVPFLIGLPVIAARARAGIIQYFAKLQANGSIEFHFNPPLAEFLDDRSPFEFAEEIVRNYVDALQAFLETNPSHLRPKKLASWRKQ